MRQKFVAAFLFEEESACGQSRSNEELEDKTDGAKVEAGVEVPAREEAVVDFVDVCLEQYQKFCTPLKEYPMIYGLTINPIATA